jgi:hypothetical protein
MRLEKRRREEQMLFEGSAHFVDPLLVKAVTQGRFPDSIYSGRACAATISDFRIYGEDIIFIG